jgi:hypothetical protein
MIDEFKMKGSLGLNPGSCNQLSNENLRQQDANPINPIGVRIDENRRESYRKGGERPCVDCKHSRQVAVGNMECHRNAFYSRDRVTGAPIIVGWTVCYLQRSEELDQFEDQYCGIEGRGFEAKEVTQ